MKIQILNLTSIKELEFKHQRDHFYYSDLEDHHRKLQFQSIL